MRCLHSLQHSAVRIKKRGKGRGDHKLDVVIVNVNVCLSDAIYLTWCDGIGRWVIYLQSSNLLVCAGVGVIDTMCVLDMLNCRQLQLIHVSGVVGNIEVTG